MIVWQTDFLHRLSKPPNILNPSVCLLITQKVSYVITNFSFILLKSRSNIFVTAYIIWLAKHLSAQQFNQIQTNIYFLIVSFSVFYKQSTAKLHFKGPWPFMGLQCIESLRLRGTSGLWLNFLLKTGSIRLLGALSNSVLKMFKVTDSTTYLGNLFQQ